MKYESNGENCADRSDLSFPLDLLLQQIIQKCLISLTKALRSAA
jgi:hypothetical protein